MGLDFWTHAIRFAAIISDKVYKMKTRTGERWKAHRRMFHRQFQQSVAPVHWPTQRKEVHTLLRSLLQSPEELIEHLRQ